MSPRRWTLALLAGGLALGALCLLPAAGAATVNETEPNDDPGNATVIQPGDMANGSNAAKEDDYWLVNVSSAGLLQIAFPFGSCGIARVAWEDNSTAPTQVAQDFSINATQVYRIALVTPRSLLIWVCPGVWGGNYTFNVSLSTNYTELTGFDEVELNGDMDHATPLPADRFADGLLSRKWADVDVWSYDPPISGWVEAPYCYYRYSSGVVLEGRNATGPVPTVTSETGTYYNVTAHDTLYLTTPRDGDGRYCVRVRIRADLSEFAPAMDDIEPNGDAAGAQVLTPGVNTTVSLHWTLDPTDVFRVAGRKGDYITVRYQPADPYTPYWGLNVTVLSGSLQFPREGTPYRTPSSSFGSTFLTTDQDLVFSLEVYGAWTANVLLNVTRVASTALADDELTLPELIAFFEPGRSGYQLQPVWDWNVYPRPSYNLANGDGYVFGRSLCFSAFSLQVNLTDVLVKAGDVWRIPDSESAYVTTRDTGLNVTGFLGQDITPDHDDPSWSCFYAMQVVTFDPVDSYGRYVDGPPLSGLPLQVLAQIQLQGADDAGGQLALWAATTLFNETRARAMGADDATLTRARTLLSAAGVVTCLNGLAGPACDGAVGWTPPLPDCSNVTVTRPRERPSNGTANQSAGQPSGPGPLPPALAAGLLALGAMAAAVAARRGRARGPARCLMPPRRPRAPWTGGRPETPAARGRTSPAAVGAR